MGQIKNIKLHIVTDIKLHESMEVLLQSTSVVLIYGIRESCVYQW